MTPADVDTLDNMLKNARSLLGGGYSITCENEDLDAMGRIVRKLREGEKDPRQQNLFES